MRFPLASVLGIKTSPVFVRFRAKAKRIALTQMHYAGCQATERFLHFIYNLSDLPDTRRRAPYNTPVQ